MSERKGPSVFYAIYTFGDVQKPFKLSPDVVTGQSGGRRKRIRSAQPVPIARGIPALPFYIYKRRRWRARNYIHCICMPMCTDREKGIRAPTWFPFPPKGRSKASAFQLFSAFLVCKYPPFLSSFLSIHCPTSRSQ